MSSHAVLARIARGPKEAALGSPDAGLALADDVLATAADDRDDAVELFFHDAYESNANLVPATAALTACEGGALGVAARVWRGGRCGFAARAVGGRDDLCALVGEARAAPPGPAPAIPQPGDAPPPVTPATTLSVSLARERALDFARRLDAAGARTQVVLVRQYQWWTAVASTAGVRAAQWHEQVNGLVRCETDAGAVVDAVGGTHLDDGWDARPAVARVAAAVAALGGPGAAPDLSLPLVLSPAVAGPLVAGLGWLLRATTAAATPGLDASVGRRIFPRALSVADDPAHPSGGNLRRVDDEGVRARRVTLVEDGVLRGFLHSSDTAAAAGVEPTGNGVRMGVPAPPAPMPSNLHVAARGDAPPPDHVELCARLETLTTMPRAGLVTLVVAGWEVRGGRRVRRVGPFDLDLPLVATWRRLTGTGDDLTFLPSADWCGTPTLHLAPPRA